MNQRSPDTPDEAEMAYAQAKRYGEDLVRVYRQERARRQELEIANEKLRIVWATAPNGLAVLDERMVVIQANPHFESLVERPNCAGCHLSELIPSQQLATVLLDAAEHRTPLINVEVTLSHPSHQRTIQVIGAPLVSGTQQGWVISLFDLTERKRLEKLKEEFIDIAAHELRTPLAIILGFAGVLSEELANIPDSTVSESVQAIVSAANRLKTIVNELVDFAAVRSSTSEGTADRFDLNHLIEQAVHAVSYQANQAEVKIVVQPSGRPLLTSGDRIMLTQAIGHLLDNAIKFNHAGGTVYVRAFQENEHIILEIEDTGVGIPVAEQERIFDVFYQVERHMTRRQGGLGMGLAIAKRAVELHGGHIEVSSTVGKGSCFRVVLPTVPKEPLSSPRAQMEIAHQQTLTYGQDLARAFIAQRTMAQRLRQVAQMCRELERLAQSGNLSEVRALARQIVRETSIETEAR
ncbi:MAG: sensor histidine kinase [Anaerolineae bacterium]